MSGSRVLYHYSSMNGVAGILSNRSIWMSDCRYLNDGQELELAVSAFSDKFGHEEKKVLQLALRWWGITQAHCVFSMSRSPEILSQWRAYADEGTGMALGIEEKYFQYDNSELKCKVVDCIYDDHADYIDNLAKNLSGYIENLLDVYDSAHGAINGFWEELDKTGFPLGVLYSSLLALKNPAFKEEAEVRLVASLPMKKTKTRVSGNVAMPYIERSLCPFNDDEALDVVVSEVWLGPKCDERNKNWLRTFLNLGWSDGIKKYDCGYR